MEGAIILEEVKKNKGGRPPNTLLDFMRIKAWLAFIMIKLNVEKYEEIKENILGPIPAGMPLSKYVVFDDYVQNVRWDRHIDLKSGPNDTYLKLIEQLPKAVGSLSVYKVGPYDNQEKIPLWTVFEQDFEVMREFLDSQIPQMKGLRKSGAPLTVKMDLVINLFVALEQWKKLSFKDPDKHPEKHIIIESYRSGYFQPSFKLLTVAMAMYRIVLNAGESMSQMEYLMRGLLAEPMSELLSKYNIYEEFTAAFNQLEINDLMQRGEIELAKKLFSKMSGIKL